MCLVHFICNRTSGQSPFRFTQHAPTTFQTFSVASFQVDWGNVPSGTSGSVNSAWRPQTRETIQCAPSKQHIDFCSELLKQKQKQNKKSPKHESNFVIFPLGIQCTSIKSWLIASSFTSEFHVRHSKYFYLFSVKHKKLSHKGCSVLVRCECLLFFFPAYQA